VQPRGLERARLRIEELERGGCRACDDARNSTIAEEPVTPGSEDERRHADLGVLEIGQRSLFAVEVPPAVAVSREVEEPVRRPLGLDHRLVRPTGDEALAGHGRVR
jgi:hypothetical protein